MYCEIKTYIVYGLLPKKSNKGKQKHSKGKKIYFPIQKLAKMFPSKSSLDISPVISPK